MGQLEDGLNDLKEIRSIMERASRFLSLSGLSGVSAGTVALLGTAAAQWYLVSGGLTLNDRAARTFLIADGVAVLLVAAALSILLSYQMAVRRKLPFWAPIARDVLESLLVPFLAGGVFILLLIDSGKMDLVPGTALIFYGLALFATSRLTVRDLRQLGILQILLGLLAAAVPAIALLLWGLGFGVLHVAYGMLMFRKYER
jgi:hypothetical protein